MNFMFFNFDNKKHYNVKTTDIQILLYDFNLSIQINS